MSNRIAAHSVIVGVDRSPQAREAVRWAVHEAVGRNAPLAIVHVTDSLPAVASTLDWSVGQIPPEVVQAQQDAGSTILAQAISLAHDCASAGERPEIIGELRFGKPAPTLVGLSKQAQIVVVGCRGETGWQHRRLLGSVSTGAVHHGHCPVAVIHDEPASSPSAQQSPVLLGIDGSPASERATEIAFGEASWRGVDLVALHVLADSTATNGFFAMEWSALQSTTQKGLAERLAHWQKRYPTVNVSVEVEFENPVRQLLARAEDAQLVVVGSHGRGGFTGMLLGSVSTAVSQESRVPVIVARGGS
ncbi:universal stress protein UspA [Mycolicibacterium conceptionense]|jgi:nucleotide-binding universal stress UspA family protein|uniref:Universal stress protein UspA n=2 Tax=Mycolicibacterium TaxID=1866885 RepID=A0ABR5FRA2_9MYCO|nr:MULTISPECIES: universal stress protein [Mycolicibacterium]KLI08134.1 universal stress protein UspA [Mycolicibacterium senegalense]KLO50473.1 universal stress protein UspA [Mycolicibacterium senegalense]KMV18633.1 universal stress protein UspA [Mycolicibacterium conceptionense]OBK09359.1 universal stress protein UspA [Mycolicibacterium conceptionense]OMB80727.1 universal stress protein UspA [Mycolicibacterium conceptionense]